MFKLRESECFSSVPFNDFGAGRRCSQRWLAVNVDCCDRAHALISVVAPLSYRQTLIDQHDLAQVQRLKRHAPV
jgi:hypothetical protein